MQWLNRTEQQVKAMESVLLWQQCWVLQCCWNCNDNEQPQYNSCVWWQCYNTRLLHSAKVAILEKLFCLDWCAECNVHWCLLFFMRYAQNQIFREHFLTSRNGKSIPTTGPLGGWMRTVSFNTLYVVQRHVNAACVCNQNAPKDLKMTCFYQGLSVMREQHTLSVDYKWQ